MDENELPGDILTKSQQRRQENFLLNVTDAREYFTFSTASDETYISGTSLQNQEDSSFVSSDSFEDSYEHANMMLAVNLGNDDPTTVREALSSSDGDKWRESMIDE